MSMSLSSSSQGSNIECRFEAIPRSPMRKSPGSRTTTLVDETANEQKRMRKSEPEALPPDGKIDLIRNNKVVASFAVTRLDTNSSTSLVESERIYSGKYIKFHVGQGENAKDYMVSIDTIRQQLFSKESKVGHLPEGVTPSEVVKFFNEHRADSGSRLEMMSDPIRDLASEVADAKIQIDTLCERSGMTRDDAEDIVNFVKCHNIKTFPDYKQGEPLHIRRNQVNPPLKCSLIVTEDGDVQVLLKGKPGLRQDCLLRRCGHFKSVKTALDLKTGEVVAHTTIDVTAEAIKRVGTNLGINFSVQNPTAEQQAKIEAEKRKIIQEVKKECEILGLYSGIKTHTFCEYQSIPTSSQNITRREEENKEIRKQNEPHTIISFSSTRAVGELGSMSEQFIQNHEQLLTGLADVTKILCRLHAENKVHRDVKLENILVVNDQGVLKLFLADFELCADVIVARSEKQGPKRLLAPEVYESLLNGTQGTPDPKKSDVYALGLAFVTLLTGLGTSFVTETIEGEDKLSQLNQKKAVGLVNETEYAKALKILKDRFEESKSEENYVVTVRSSLADLGYPDALVNMILGMLEIDPNKRLDMQQVLTQLGNLTPDMFYKAESPQVRQQAINTDNYFNK